MSITYGGDTIIDSSGGILRPISSVMRNRIINGAMVIDQRNAGASVTTTTTNQQTYTIDRWGYNVTQASKFTVQQNAGAVTPPVGFSNYLGVTSTSAYSPTTGDSFAIRQAIEGFNTADLGWGTANAKTVTLSFQVYSSLTGTFGGSLNNSAYSRSYPFSYSIPVANTWTTISVTIAGDTTGTWVGATNGVGLYVGFSLGVGSTYAGTVGSWSGSTYLGVTGQVSVVGTSGATFYITGVQLEVGTSATGFEYKQYQQELALCQRYYQGGIQGVGYGNSTTTVALSLAFLTTMRTVPTISITSALTVTDGAANYTQSSAVSGAYLGTANGGLINAIANFTSITNNRPYIVNTNGFNNPITASAEL